MRWSLLLILVLVGCSSKPKSDPHGPVLIHLSGIQGQTVIDRLFMERVGEEVGATAEHYQWTGGERWMIGALQAVEKNRAESVKLAERITQLRRSDPGRRIILTGHSGGAGFAVFALEQLPPDVQVDALVLLAPAISPEYDLSPALARVKESAYAFYSEYDVVILGAGTNAFGTMDGRREASAGMVGFSLPPTAEPRQYAKLVALPYQSSWARYSNFGDHWGPIHPSFGEKVVGPLLATGMLPQ